MLTRARAEAASLLEGLPCARHVAIRRALSEGWMLAVDLPQAAEPETVRLFVLRAEARGWRTLETDGWLLLDNPGLLELPGVPDPLPGGERGCVYSLLRRHPEFREDVPALRLIAAASEMSPRAAETLYRRVHIRWAEALRTRRTGHDTKGETPDAD